MRIILFPLVLCQIVIFASCAHVPNTSDFFREDITYFVRGPIKGDTFTMITRDDSKLFGYLFKKMKPKVKKIMEKKGFRFVESTADASLVLILGYYEKKQKLNGVDIYISKLYISSAKQEYGERPYKYFDIVSSFYKHRSPPEGLIFQTYKNLISMLDNRDFSVKKSISGKKPGCSPRFSFESKKNELGQVVVTRVVKGQAFELAGVKEGDIFLSANSLPYEEIDRRENSKKMYNLKKGTRFVFIRNGKSFEKVIKPKLSCKDWAGEEES